MTNPHGSFIWYELMTKDPEASKAFYGDVIGWTVGEAMPGGMDYRMLTAPDGHVGGMLGLTDAMCEGGARPCWLGYFGVDDVDQALEKVTAAGGQVMMAASDIPDVGRIAMVTDPQGVPFYVMRGASDEASHAYDRMTPGHVSWNELLTPDPDAALDFYGSIFGYRKEGAMPMPGMGDYIFISHGGGDPIGAVMKNSDGTPAAWGFYFRVPDIDAAKARVEQGGGRVIFGPEEVPGGEMVLNAIDPEGVLFGLVAPK
ncbi:VOC family protein [Sphingomonas gilva]|uniref:VOC family protein n=1 Tax=Sphingomonas gilva TaxID=2305907 RepID=A0A396S640_9SPHN|nr:VOC family protein [Sphingomonas gilva]RHW18875.1 VOC family protein [Sphingomonas gilva]